MNGLQIHAYVQRELSGLMDPWDGYFTLNVVAVPEPVSYTVTYYANGGAFPGGATSMSGVLTDDYIQENGSYVGDLGDSGWVATPEREGYEFRGWSEDPDWVEGDMAYDDGSLNSDHYPDGMAITGDVSLYACWVAEQPEPTPTTLYTVTYDANGGTFGNSESTRTETSGDRVYTVSSTTPTMAGYDFSHWTLSNGNVYHPDEAIELNGDIMFTAQWTEHYDDAPTAVYISVYNEEDYTFYTDFYGGDTYFTVDSAVEGTGGSGLTYLWEESYDRSSWMEASWGDSESATLDYIIPGMSGYSEIRFFRLTVNGVHSNIATVRVVMDYMGVYCATLDANGGRFANGDT